MAAFDYGNARIRVMKSRLLPQATLQKLAGAGSVEALLDGLAQTPYRAVVEKALVHASGLAAVRRALQDDLVSTVGRIPRFFTGAAAARARAAAGRYDVDNVKSVLRGLSRQLPADEIAAATLPVGNLAPADLAALARAETVREAVDLLLTWRLPLAHPLLRLRAERPAADLFEMEVALERWYFSSASAERGALGEMMRLEADITNILTVLRLAGAAEAETLLAERFGAADVTPLLVGPGRISFERLLEAAGRPTVPEAAARLADSPYGTALAAGREGYQAFGQLSRFETALAGYRLQQASLLFIRDPLGIGVFVGYLALKTAEAANLRRIAQGVALGEPAGVTAAGLIGPAGPGGGTA